MKGKYKDEGEEFVHTWKAVLGASSALQKPSSVMQNDQWNLIVGQVALSIDVFAIHPGTTYRKDPEMCCLSCVITQ